MFDALINRLKALQTEGVSVPVNADSDGYLDRECPNEACLFRFKVFEEDWKNLCKDEAIHCPLCGHQAPSKSWWTKEQLDAAEREAMTYLEATINWGLAEGAREFNRHQKQGFITMSMKVDVGPERYSIVPIAALEAMKLRIQCESCSTRFAVVGSAFFCPCCGFNSVERIFEDALKKIEVKLDLMEVIRAALEDRSDKDNAATTCRSMIEEGLNNCVVAFQKLMESLYMKLPGAAKPKLNTFQRIDSGSNLWKQTCGKGYDEWLSAQDLAEMKVLFHRRHLLSHTGGFVDERYISKSGDTSYSLGQRIVVREKDIRRLLEIVRLLAGKARATVPLTSGNVGAGNAAILPVANSSN